MTENPYSASDLPSDDRGPQEIADELHSIATYSRRAIRLIPVQILVPIGGIILEALNSKPPPEHAVVIAGQFALVGYVLAFGFVTFQLTRFVYRPALSPVMLLVLTLLSMCFPLGFLAALLPLYRAYCRMNEIGVRFGWLGPDAQEVEARIAELQSSPAVSAEVVAPKDMAT